MMRIKILSSFFVIVCITANWGCGMKQLRMENEGLRKEVDSLQQLQRDYSDKLRELESLSAEEKAAMRSEMDQMRQELNANLEEQIEEKNALVQKVRDLTIIEIGEAALFGSGEADLTKDGSRVIRQLTEVLDQYPGYHIRVEGHTDSVPIGAELKSIFPSNWELSSARATTVVRYMIYGLEFDPMRLSAVGHGKNRPIVSNGTRDGRAKNRRIQLIVFKAIE